ncbi:MAG: hypothetical protein LBK46_03290, partial [Oscillospiraceae bacterium]|nr:hypothetical protein [Oscillospiraceae bacterium]
VGAFHEDEAFHIDDAAAKAYDGLFPHKEPADMIPISVLLDCLKAAPRSAFESRDIKHLARLNGLSGREMAGWDGMDDRAMETVNRTLAEYGYAVKLLPSSPVLQSKEIWRIQT